MKKNEMMKTNAHVIGNGASKKWFRDTNEFTVVCNLEWSHRHDVVSIIDPQPVAMMKHQGIKTRSPIWCTGNVTILSQAQGIRLNIQHEYRSKHRFNSGHYAVRRLCDLGYRNIHLWGFDSIWSDDLTSSMDDRIPRPGRKQSLKNDWWVHWQWLHQQYANTEFILHLPAKDSFTNAKTRFREHAHLAVSHQPNQTT